MKNAMKGKKTMRLLGLLVSLTTVFGTMTPGVSQAQSGTPDPAFGVLGRVLTTFETATDQAFAVALQPDGKIVAAGFTTSPIANGDNNFAVVRYNPDGSMDPTFGTGGGVITNFRSDVPTGDPDNPRRNSSDTARAIAIQPDGKIVVGGFSDAPNGEFNFALVRYNPDGSVDPTFGDNAIFPGTILTNFRQLPGGTRSLDQLRALVLQSDGKIVAVGLSNAPNGEGNFALVRYSPDGIIDPTFGDNAIAPGTVLTDFGNRSVDDAFAVAIQSDGQLVVAGSTSANPNCPAAFGLVRYNNGVPNTNFGPNNRVATCLRGTSAVANALVIQANGRIVAVGTTNGPNGDLNFGLARYNLNGTLDSTFNASSINPGLSITDFDNRALGDGTVERSADYAYAAAMQADGQIVVAGISNAPLGVGNTNFALVRYDLNGVATTEFGSNNRVLTDLANTSDDHVRNSSTDQANAIAIQPDGLIVVAGGSDAPIAAVGGPSFNFGLVRYLP
jgi:uncharacterized delta-60 repeat protein